MTRKLAVGIVLCAAVAAACNSGSAPTSAPTNPPATSAPATAAPATPAPTAPAPTTSPTGLDGGAAAVFKPKAGGTPSVTGEAVLTEVDGKTKVVITVVSSGTAAMAASIQAGACDNLNPEIAYRLSDIAAGSSTTTVDVKLSTLLASPFSINISVLGSETESSISCGEIKATPAS